MKDLLKVRGEYGYNPQGGVVRWTRRDPGMGIKHGWIERLSTVECVTSDQLAATLAPAK